MWWKGLQGVLRGRNQTSFKSQPESKSTPEAINEAQNSAVYLHIKATGHSINIKDATILDKEEQWHRRGIKEAIWERVEEPGGGAIANLKQKGRSLRYSLSHMGPGHQADPWPSITWPFKRVSCLKKCGGYHTQRRKLLKK